MKFGTVNRNSILYFIIKIINTAEYQLQPLPWQRLVEVWSHFSQAIIDEAIDEWRKRLLACVQMKGYHFEHLM